MVSACLLVVYRNTTCVCVCVDLVACDLIKLIYLFQQFFGRFLEIFYTDNDVICQRRSFDFFFSNVFPSLASWRPQGAPGRFKHAEGGMAHEALCFQAFLLLKERPKGKFLVYVQATNFITNILSSKQNMFVSPCKSWMQSVSSEERGENAACCVCPVSRPVCKGTQMYPGFVLKGQVSHADMEMTVMNEVGTHRSHHTGPQEEGPGCSRRRRQGGDRGAVGGVIMWCLLEGKGEAR